MPSSINSTSSSPGGLISTGATDNELEIKTGDTTAISIDASQNVTVAGDLTVNGTLVGAGDVVGPASATDNAVARFDGTTGKLIQNSSLVVNDSGEITAGVWQGTEISVAKGGTGATTLTANNVILGNGTSAVQFVAPGANGNVLTSNGTTWTSAAGGGGSGDVVGPASATDNAVARFDGTTGKLIQNSAVTIDDSNNVTGIANLSFNSGYGSSAVAYGCRAWVKFNGTGTPAISASGNVSSIADNGVGKYTITFSTAMPDADYAVANSASEDSAYTQFLAIVTQTSSDLTVQASGRITSGGLRYVGANRNGDPTIGCLVIFR